MSKEKLPLIILAVLLLICAFISYKFYLDNRNLTEKIASLQKEKADLEQAKEGLEKKYKQALKQQKLIERAKNEIEDQLAALQVENANLKHKYEVVSAERDKLVKKVSELSRGIPSLPPSPKKEKTVSKKEEKPSPENIEYLADIVKRKAELEATLDNLKKELLNTKSQLAQLQRDNKELSLKIDELTKEKERLEMEMAFKSRTFDIMSRDLVAEREARKKAFDELSKFRQENLDLKRELILANKEKTRLQDKLKEAYEKKEALERTVAEVESVLKEKTMMFSELQDQLTKAVGGVKEETSSSAKTEESKSSSIELPPIVVKSTSTSPSSGSSTASTPTSSVTSTSVSSEGRITGEILAVNSKESFVIIDQGRLAGVKPGMKFNVVRGGKVIGTIEVIETRKEISAADIKQLFSGYSILEGDRVVVQ